MQDEKPHKKWDEKIGEMQDEKHTMKNVMKRTLKIKMKNVMKRTLKAQ